MASTAAKGYVIAPQKMDDWWVNVQGRGFPKGSKEGLLNITLKLINLCDNKTTFEMHNKLIGQIQ